MNGREVASSRSGHSDERDSISAGKSPVDRLWANAMSEMIEDLRSLALQCRGLAHAAGSREMAETLLQAADEYDLAAEQLSEKGRSPQ